MRFFSLVDKASVDKSPDAGDGILGLCIEKPVSRIHNDRIGSHTFGLFCAVPARSFASLSYLWNEAQRLCDCVSHLARYICRRSKGIQRRYLWLIIWGMEKQGGILVAPCGWLFYGTMLQNLTKPLLSRISVIMLPYFKPSLILTDITTKHQKQSLWAWTPTLSIVKNRHTIPHQVPLRKGYADWSQKGELSKDIANGW